MAVSLNDVYRIVISMATSEGDLMQNVFNAIVTGIVGTPDEADVVDDLTDWIDDIFGNIGSWMKLTTDPVETKVYKYDAGGADWDEVGSGTPAFTTTGAGQRLPLGVAALVNARTVDPDVSGKKYFGGFTETTWGEGGWDGGFLTALAAAAVDWGTEFSGAASLVSFSPVIWSPTNVAAYRMSEVYTIPAFAAYQRRRKPGVGA